MDRFGPTGKVSKKRVHLLRWTTFPGRTGWNFGWKDRALRFIAHACNERFKMAVSKENTGSRRSIFKHGKGRHYLHTKNKETETSQRGKYDNKFINKPINQSINQKKGQSRTSSLRPLMRMLAWRDRWSRGTKTLGTRVKKGWRERGTNNW